MILKTNALRLVVAFVDVAKARPGGNQDDENQDHEDDDATAGNH